VNSEVDDVRQQIGDLLWFRNQVDNPDVLGLLYRRLVQREAQLMPAPPVCGTIRNSSPAPT
jgi:hypothetical protein